ncbi:MAG: hypothetical protein AABX96_00640 [Nanoarchaeota archaeon]
MGIENKVSEEDKIVIDLSPRAKAELQRMGEITGHSIHQFVLYAINQAKTLVEHYEREGTVTLTQSDGKTRTLHRGY